MNPPSPPEPPEGLNHHTMNPNLARTYSSLEPRAWTLRVTEAAHRVVRTSSIRHADLKAYNVLVQAEDDGGAV
ncbi:hypothetical protein PLEOSDRAFT_1103361 [Pleurotus ostreatus PC15]|uniref:Protein kinase domain-containing protein n=1 Tax=Pleurotus ostreatus (strain PC15) TaxID=1137138 RepID=A0A067NYY9_PLEO1|nr:hypothetical protein PLEOSDRAFT_1103361 [Pleurotus ostreatus PC15]